jgi:ribosome-associated toxin RatA of RatAB toxin-antitoxin module
VAYVVEWAAVASSPEALLALVRDYAQRERFLPDGWRLLRRLGAASTGPGAQFEIEAKIGPAPTTHVVQLLREGDDYVEEGPPGGENYLTVWTVQARGEDAIVQVEVQFAYGGLIGEFFVRRRLRRALHQMLQRLKAIAEAR